MNEPGQGQDPGQHHDRKRLRIGMVGHAFMGAAHSQAWRSVNRFFDLPLEAEMTAICGRDPDRTEAARVKFGWESAETDWRDLVARDDIDLIDVCTPGDSHAAIAIAALEAGKHVLCEKPLAVSLEQGEKMVSTAAKAEAAGVRSMVGFTYRRVPALSLLARLIGEGRVGRIHHVRAVYLQDWLVDPNAPITWRMQAERAGSGALGDIGSHIIDMIQFVTGERVVGVSGLTETFVTERPVVGGSSGLSASSANEAGAAYGWQPTGEVEMAPVTVDDGAVFIARLSGGALATFEATRFAMGRKNGQRIEINGSKGSFAFDMERMNELEYCDGSLPPSERGFTKIFATEADHPYAGAWWPPGHMLGYEHGFTHQARDFMEAIAQGTDIRPSFADAFQVEQVVDAVARSKGNWIDLGIG